MNRHNQTISCIVYLSDTLTCSSFLYCPSSLASFKLDTNLITQAMVRSIVSLLLNPYKSKILSIRDCGLMSETSIACVIIGSFFSFSFIALSDSNSLPDGDVGQFFELLLKNSEPSHYRQRIDMQNFAVQGKKQLISIGCFKDLQNSVTNVLCPWFDISDPT